MFELSIFCVIALAIGYWATLFLMGRREDVLHGDFVEGKEQSEPTATQLPTEQLPSARPASAETLQSLLNAIKQDLRDAARI
jgi:hypothetical protein